MPDPITDPELLAQLNGGSMPKSVADPALLAQLNAAPSTVEDVAKSGGIGVAKGVIGLAGLPGDAKSLIGSGLSYIESKLGRDPETIKKSDAAMQAAPSILPTSGGIQSAIESKTGEFYKPKTTAGEYAQTTGEFLPGILGGPGGVVRRGITQVVAPALASETAGQLTKGTAAEPYARVVGALAGGMGASGIANSLNKTAIPTAEEITTAAKGGYNHPEVKALEIKPAAVSTATDSLVADLNRSGFRPLDAPKVYSVIDELKTPSSFSAATGGAVSKIDDIQAVRRALNVSAGEVNAIGKPTVEALVAKKAISGLDNFVQNVKQPDVVTGNAARASELLKEANANYSSSMHAQDVSARLTRAERQAAKAGSGSNIDNAIRQKISAILDVPSRTRGYTADEIAQMEKIVRGTAGSNITRKVGKLGFNDGLSLLLHAGATLPTGGANIPVGIAGTIARKIGERITSGNADKLGEMIRSRSPLAQSVLATAPKAIDPKTAGIISALLASDSSRGAIRSQQPVMEGR